MRYQLQPTLADYRNLALAGSKRANASARMPKWQAFLLAMLVGLIVSMAQVPVSWLQGRHVDPSTLLIGEFIGATALLIIVFGIWRAQLANIKNWVQPDGYALSPRILTIEDDGIRTEGPSGMTLVTWPFVKDVSDTPSLIVIWLDTSIGIMVPATAFESGQDREEFLNKIRSKTEPALLPAQGHTQS